MLTTSTPMSAAVTKEASSAAVDEKPHHWEIFRATSLTLGAMPLVPVPFRAAAMLPPIQEPCPFQSVVAGPPSWAARSWSDRPNRVLQIGSSPSRTVRSITWTTLEASSAWVKSRPVSATPTVTLGLPAVSLQPWGRPMRR
jgi:hypothetical protein